MPVLVRNSIAFLVAIAIYVSGLWAAGYIFELLHLQWGLSALLLFSCAFGIVGYFLFRGNSRAVLVLLVSVTCGVALEVVAPDQRHVQVFVSIAFGVLAAIVTNLTGWVVERVTITHSRSAVGEAQEAERFARRKSTLAYRLGKWVGYRLHGSGREK